MLWSIPTAPLLTSTTYETEAFAEDDVVAFTYADGEIQTMYKMESVSGELTKKVIEKSLTAYGTIVVAPTLPDCADIANQIAPEHMELSVADPYGLLPLIENAGAIFLGHYSPEPLGDYLAGPNHVLPTSGTARFFSPLSVDDFVKKSSFIYYTREALGEVQGRIANFAEHEGLHAHARSVTIRFEE